MYLLLVTFETDDNYSIRFKMKKHYLHSTIFIYLIRSTKNTDTEIRARGHLRSSKLVLFYRQFASHSNFVSKMHRFEIFAFEK